MLQQFIVMFPELLLTLFALSAQLLVVFNYFNIQTIINCIITVICTLLLLLLLAYLVNEPVSLWFNGSLAIGSSISSYKMLVLLFTLATIVIYNSYCKISDTEIKIEFVTLLIFSTIGIFLSISARNLLLLFCGLELQALTAYALAGFNGDIKSSEAAVKYFVLGALISCISLLGISFLYGFSGSLDFEVIFSLFTATEAPNLGLVVGAVLMLASILFKLSAAPLHMWTPDVYEGSPIGAVTYFATAQKIGVLIILLNIINFVIGDYASISILLIKIVAIISMIIGALGAIMQKSLKRLMAYSTVLNVGYVLIGVSLYTESGKFAAMLYMFIYSTGALAFFTCLIALFGEKIEQATFDDLNGIASSRKTMAGVISVIMFSMIGLPPLAGFFGKYYIFYEALKQDELLLAIIGVVTSVIAGFYYLKIIRSMYFVKSSNKLEKITTNRGLLIVTSITTCFILFFSFFATNYLKYLF